HAIPRVLSLALRAAGLAPAVFGQDRRGKPGGSPRQERAAGLAPAVFGGEPRRGPTTMEPSPTYLQIEPVGQCNLRCQMCPIQFRRDGPPYGPPAFMAWDVFTRLIDGLPGLEELQLQGRGEPMMHPRFFDMIAYAGRRGVRVG